MLYICLYDKCSQALLRAILRDEMITWHKKNSDHIVSTIIDANGQQQVIALMLFLLYIFKHPGTSIFGYKFLPGLDFLVGWKKSKEL